MNVTTTSPKSPIPGRETDMVENNEGGFVFDVGIWAQFDRFLILGSEGGSYYVGENKLTEDNAQNVIKCIKADGERVVKRIVEISVAGRAPKNDPALFALALTMTYGNEATKRAAYSAISEVARIGTHILHLAEYVNAMRGWGRGIRKAFGNWYLNQTPKGLAMNLVKYANRDGWTHGDVLRLAHPKTDSVMHDSLFSYVLGKGEKHLSGDVGAFIGTVDIIKTVKNPKDAAKLITDFKLPREVVPTELLNNKEVWEALLPHMGIIALVRNLATMTRVGLIGGKSDAESLVLSKLKNNEEMVRSKIHPLQVLTALKTYTEGRGFRGTNTWTPVTKISDALDELFYRAFKNVVPTGKSVLYGLDVSASMTFDNIANTNITPREATAALAMVAAQVEQDVDFMAFSHTFVPVDISKKRRLDDVINAMDSMSFGGTNCSLPMLWALKENRKYDAFVVLTDNETYAGTMHPQQALKKYRDKFGSAKQIVVGMTATNFSIADPTDKDVLDVIGFDTATPNIMSDFIRGDI